MLKIVTECPEHGAEIVEAPRVALATTSGRIFTFSEDPETGGLLVAAGGETLAVGIFTGADGTMRPDALVLMAEAQAVDVIETPDVPKNRLN